MPLSLSHNTTYSYFCKSMSKNIVHHFQPVILHLSIWNNLWMCYLFITSIQFRFIVRVCVYAYTLFLTMFLTDFWLWKIISGIFFSILQFCIWTHFFSTVAKTHWAHVVSLINVSFLTKLALICALVDARYLHFPCSSFPPISPILLLCVMWDVTGDLWVHVSCLFSCKC